ncbi:unnamed protein product [Ambrosiozyma monospora]|uniref:Unnamed protein product n=1 Tax=Ambrosiozyma monospora TaxID=43982 RepID=A0ACB5TK94_AMBMO|nr:unnamed protein product [Ambrosiozyma monospora]
MFEFITLSPSGSTTPTTEQRSSSQQDSADEDDAYDPMALDSDSKVKQESKENDNDIAILPHSTPVQTGITQARLLTFDKQINILADPGWDGKSDLSYLEEIVPKVDLIILSHTTIEYLGAYAMLLYKYPILRRIKTYSTLPIAKLGRLATTELYRAMGLIGPIESAIMEVDDIESAFNNIISLNYAQSIGLQGNLTGITITSYNSGHTLGGSIWQFNRGAEKIVYAPAWNHSKDSFLVNSKLNLPNLMRPTTLISGSDLGSSKSHKHRVEEFLKLANVTLNNNSTLFLPTSMTGRFFELILLLEKNIDLNIPFYLVSYTGVKSMQFSANMLEWMSSDITKNWETQNQSPFESTRIQLITLQELEQLDQGPKILFTESLDMSEGSLGRACLATLCTRHHTAIMMTEGPHPDSTFYDLYAEWERLVSQDNRLKS